MSSALCRQRRGHAGCDPERDLRQAGRFGLEPRAQRRDGRRQPLRAALHRLFEAP
jgi:hypothetical protein